MLRRIRIGIALLVVLLCLFTFLGGEQATTVLSALFKLQFTPALLKAIQGGGIALVSVLALLALTFVFGRVYCAGLCPLGILQDAAIFLARKIRKKHPHRFQKPYPFLRYGILLVTAVSAMLGSFVALNFLDPYSFFGRTSAHVIKPLVVAAYNFGVSLLETFEIYAIAILPRVPFLFPMFILVVALLGMAFLRGRMYCNTLCPVGALLGIIARFAHYRITLSDQECVACGLCAKGCRAGCIDVAHKTIDATRCVACFDCLELCPQSAITYTHNKSLAAPERIDLSKRKLFTLSATAAGALIAACLPLRTLTKPLIPQGRTIPIIPPGALSIDHFTETCTACHLCVSACPAHAIQQASFAYGLCGLLQPTLNYQRGYCMYECNLCGRVCPTGAIKPLALADKKLTQIGQASLFKERCVVHTKNQECGACVEVCPTHAVYTVERDNILYPETKVEHCIGCGRCENVCPVPLPRAIIVKGNEVHAKSLEPYFPQQPARKEQVQQGKDGFPF